MSVDVHHGLTCRSLVVYHLANRSLYPPGWRALEKATKAAHPFCTFCLAKGSSSNARRLQVHHIAPIHLHPELALVPANLIVLCSPCHLYEGHVGDFTHGYDVEVAYRAAGNAAAILAARAADVAVTV